MIYMSDKIIPKIRKSMADGMLLVDRLPVWNVVEEVNSLLAHHPSIVLTAPPGAGKSTLSPLTVLDAIEEGRVIVVEPRRIATIQIAERMSAMIGEPVGNTVGYRVRFDTKVSASTRIEVITEGILLRMLVEDPTLDGISVVMFDEFHERSLASDTALALVREAQGIIRPDLHLVIMSATIDTDNICRSLNAPLVESQGRMYDVEILHGEEATVYDCASQVASAIMKAHREHEGDILAFLPGQAEIMKCSEILGDSLGSTYIFPLYGMLTPQQQRRAIMPSHEGERKLVLATSIAETSLTIEGVRVVVDSGFCRRMVFDPRSGLSHLDTVRISLDMARQRTGRAGRVGEGVCYRLWTLATEHRMDECRKPEIVEADLSSVLLDISAWGAEDIMSLPWLTPPPQSNVAQARQLLLMLDAIYDNGRITPHGKRLASLPCHPRIAQMLLSAETDSLKELAADIAAILEEKDISGIEPGSVVIIRAHGVAPSVIDCLEKKECIIINATCPRVMASQKNARKYAALDFTVILAGDKNHGEVTGIAGYAGNSFVLVQNDEEAKDYIRTLDGEKKAVLLSQTTFSPLEFERISKTVSSGINGVLVMNTICPATKERQDALLRLCPQVDGVLVVGGKNSANTKRLLQTAKEHCAEAELIETADEIPERFFSMQTVGITAGASTPDDVIKAVQKTLECGGKV